MAFDLVNNTDCINDDQSTRLFPPVKLRFSPTTTILVYAAYLLPFCFGVFGNISVCLIFFQQKKLRSITNTFLMNLCLNDLIVLCVSTPMTLSSALLEYWIFGGFLCKFLNFTPTLTALVSTFTVAVIAVERWLFIVNKKKFDRRCTILILILLWIVSIAIAIPDFISRSILAFDAPPESFPIMSKNSSEIASFRLPCHPKKVYYCVLKPDLRTRIFSYIVITVQYLVPFLFVSISCYSISRFLKRRMKQMRVYQTPRSTNTFIHHTTNTSENMNSRRKKYSQRQTSEEIVEHESTSCDEIPVTIVTNDHKSNNLLTRFRHKFQTRDNYQDSIIIDNQNSRSSSFAGTILMPNVKSQSHSERRFRRSKKLLICVAALFTISWLPLTIIQIYLEHIGQAENEESVTVYAYLIPAYLISSLSAWMNPVIYNYINRSFRREFYALYPCCCKMRCSSSSAAASTTTTFLPTGTSRAELSSVIPSRLERQQLKDIDDETSVIEPYRTSKLSTRFVTFADVDNKTRSSLMMINEHN